MSTETKREVLARCLDFWRDDLYTSNGVATPFAANAIVGEFALAGYVIVKVDDPEHNCRLARNGTYYCVDSLGMLCDGNWPTVEDWHHHLEGKVAI